MSLQLHSWPHSSGTRVCWALEELGLPYEYVEVDGAVGAHRRPGFLALNPHGKVPLLIDGGHRLFESTAILLHLGETRGVDAGLWPAASDPARTEALCWTVWAGTDLGPQMMQYLYHGLDAAVSFAAADRSRAAAAYALSQFRLAIDVLADRLSRRPYLLGERYTFADLAVASELQFGQAFGVTVDALPIEDWLQRCSARPACRRAR